MKKVIIKISILKHAAIALLMVGSFSCSQNKQNEESGKFSWSEKKTVDNKGNAFYEPCPCEEDRSLYRYQIPNGEATLFIVESEEPWEGTYGIKYPWIVFEPQKNIATLFYHSYERGDIPIIGKICNFPDAVKKWDIPEKGCKVDFEGITYTNCLPLYEYVPGNIVEVDFLLTSLKIK